LLLLFGCTGQTTQTPVPVDDLPPFFRDVTAVSGLDFTYRNGEEADHYAILESLGGGIILLDYDGDGLLDIFVTGGGYFDGPDKKQIKGHPCKLYKNLGGFNFKDVTAEVGLDIPWFYTHGGAAADYDCDGFPDLLVTGWGRVALFHNVSNGYGGRKFVEVTKEAGLPEGLWTTSAAWADLDGDGYPDLYLCQYVNWSFTNHPTDCSYDGGTTRDVCPPKSFSALAHRLFHNKGNRTFEDVSRESGLRADGKGLGVLAFDVNGDAKPDIYVANDTTENFLYLNESTRGKIRLKEVGRKAMVDVDDRGQPNGSMGVDAADYDGTGRASIFVTNYEGELHALYRNLGNGGFLFNTPTSGLMALGRSYVGFGTAFVDVDNDGWEDLVIANGHVVRHPFKNSREQQPVLMRNLGTGRFDNVTARGGTYFQGRYRARGLAVGDLDNDGRPDLVISHIGQPIAVLKNECNSGNHWLGIELVGHKHRDVAGARVIVEAGGRKLTRFAKGGGSYLSSGDRRLLFGLGTNDNVDRVTVVWPGGREQRFAAPEIDRYHRLVETQ
jgi:hypothetical protein